MIRTAMHFEQLENRRGDRRRRNVIWLTVGGILLILLFVPVLLYSIDEIISPAFADDLPKADRVVVRKADRRLELLRNDKILRTYTIALGDSPVGHKEKEGDEKTPEGDYVLDWRNPNSCCYKSIHISYPNEQDRKRAKANGHSPGGMIMIHGQLNGTGWLSGVTQATDWTDGCIAVSNTAMEEIWNSVDNGTPITILP